MAQGPGKYGDELDKALEGLDDAQGILVIIKGPRGPGFTASVSPEAALDFPEILRNIADSIEQDNKLLIS